MRRAPLVRLPQRERRALRALATSAESPRRVALRARQVLRAADGLRNDEVAAELGVSAATVGRWRRRYLLHGIAGITKEAPRPGRPPRYSETTIRALLRTTVTRRPPDAPVWSTRRLARETGVSKSTVHRVWKARGLDPRAGLRPAGRASGMGFFDRVTDMVGVYLDRSERAVAFSTDERAAVSQLDSGERRALDRLERRSRGAEFRSFLQVVERETPPGLDVHLLVDSRLAPTPPEIERWLAHHPRVHLHYLPADPVASTLIDRLIGEFARRRANASTQQSAKRLAHSIREHYHPGRGSGRPFIWTASGSEIRGRTGQPDISTGINGTARSGDPK
jgi:transposase